MSINRHPLNWNKKLTFRFKLLKEIISFYWTVVVFWDFFFLAFFPSFLLFSPTRARLSAGVYPLYVWLPSGDKYCFYSNWHFSNGLCMSVLFKAHNARWAIKALYFTAASVNSKYDITWSPWKSCIKTLDWVHQEGNDTFLLRERSR